MVSQEIPTFYALLKKLFSQLNLKKPAQTKSQLIRMKSIKINSTSNNHIKL